MTEVLFFLRYAYEVALELFRGTYRLPKQFTATELEVLRKFKRACRRTRCYPLFAQVTSDYRPGDQAAAKVVQALTACLEAAKLRVLGITEVSVDELETYPCGFSALMQIGTFSDLMPAGTFAYLNVAPIYKDGDTNGHHKFYAVLLQNGKIAFSPNADFSLTALLPFAVAIVELETYQAKKQFRSWQCFTRAVAKFLAGDFSGVLAVHLPNGNHGIPSVAPTTLADRDNFGNGRLNVTKQDADKAGWQSGDVLVIESGDRTLEAYYLDAPDDADVDGVPAIARPGSNIVQMGDDDTRLDYIDVFVIGASALDLLGGWRRNSKVIVVNRSLEARVAVPA